MPRLNSNIDFQAEMDLGTLMEADKIRKDSNRLAATKRVASKKMEEAQEALKFASKEDEKQAEEGFRRIPVNSILES